MLEEITLATHHARLAEVAATCYRMADDLHATAAEAEGARLTPAELRALHRAAREAESAALDLKRAASLVRARLGGR